MKTELLAQCEKTIGKAIESALTSYNSPLGEAVKSALKDDESKLKSLANESVNELLDSGEFKAVMKAEMKKKLARVLISQFGGEIEKTVGKLKSDPATRAKITLAVDSVVSELTQK